MVSIRFSPAKLCILGNGGASGAVSRISRRSFASSGSNLAVWGFIGLGRMGKILFMASNVNRCNTLVEKNERVVRSTC